MPDHSLPPDQNAAPHPISFFGFSPSPAHDGWWVCPAMDTGRYQDMFGRLLARKEPDGKARIRVQPKPAHRNSLDILHGGFVLSVIDYVLFVGPAMAGQPGIFGSVTIDLTTQFLAPVRIEEPHDIVLEVLRATGKMVFSRGTVEQNGTICAAFSGAIRKPGTRAGQAPPGAG